MSRWLGYAFVALVVVGLVVLVVVSATNWDGFLHVIGVLPRNPVSSSYNFWSGFGSDMSEVLLVGAIIGIWRKVNCHTPWCPRFGHHEWTDSNGVVHKLCRKHHPKIDEGTRLTVANIARHEARKVKERT